MERKLIEEFNSVVNNINFVSFSERTIIESRLKLIIPEELNIKASSIEANNFVSNLYKVLVQSCDLKSEFLWNIVKILTHLSNQNEWAIKLASEFKFPFVLVKLVLSLDDDELKLKKVLILLQKLTFIEPINYLDQPYLEEVVSKLVSNVDHRSEEIARLSLSVLVNICNKNESATYALSRKVNSSTFAKQHKDYGILSYKIFMILEGISTLKTKDVHDLLNLCFGEIRKAISSYDSIVMEHCLDCFVSLKSVEDVNLKVQNRNICDEIEALCHVLTENFQSNITDEPSSSQSFFYNRIFKIFNCLLKLDGQLSTFLDDFLKVSLDHVTKLEESNFCALTDLLTTYFMTNPEELKEQILNTIFEIYIPFTLEHRKNSPDHCQVEISFLQFLSAFVRNSKLEKDERIFKSINDEFFDGIFCELLSNDAKTIDLSEERVRIYIEAVKTLASFSTACPKIFYAKLEDTIKLKPMVLVFAKGHLIGDESTIITMLDLSKLPEFPTKQVAEMIVKQRKQMETSTCMLRNREIEVFRSNQINQLLVENSNELIEKINQKLETNQSICSSEIIALYKHKINFANGTIETLAENLKRSSESNVKLMQQITNLGSVIDKQETVHFKLELKNEQLESELKNVEQTSTALKLSLTNFQKKIEGKEVKIGKIQKSLDIKMSELQELKDERTELVKNYNEKIKKLEQSKEDNLARIDEMKNSLKDSEKNLREALKKLHSQEEDAAQQKTKILSLEIEISKLNKVINQLQKDYAKKAEEVEQYETELKEMEAMRQTILSAMTGASKVRSKK